MHIVVVQQHCDVVVYGTGIGQEASRSQLFAGMAVKPSLLIARREVCQAAASSGTAELRAVIGVRRG